MKIKKLSKNISTESSKLIENIINQLEPEDPTLLTYHNNYVKTSKFRISQDLDIVKRNFTKDHHILEVGSIPLLFTVALSKTGYMVTGCDISPERYSSTIKNMNLQIIKCDIEKNKLPSNNSSYDAVIFNEIFEHLRINLIFTLSELFRVLKPGGKLILSTPNLRSLKGIYNFLFKGISYSRAGDIFTEYEKLERLGHMGHVREYTSTEVINLLKKIGFEISEINYRGNYNHLLARLFLKLFKSLSPFITFIFTKPNSI